MLENDRYVIFVVAFDISGQGAIRGIFVDVQGNAKLGNFHLEFTDLLIPLAGIPITVTRIYDTLNASREGDFGYGWTLGIQDPHILETVPPGPGNGLFSTGHPFIPGKTRVYLTDPDGRRVGFTYNEELVTAGIFSAVYRPVFTPDPGIYDNLDAPGSITRGMFGFQDYNPDEYTLTTKDGLKYHYTQGGGLQTITDLNGNIVTFTADGIEHSSGQSIQFTRDGRGRITQIADPVGNTLIYRYNATGDLVTVTDRTGSSVTYSYRTTPAHYLDSISNGLGLRVAQNEYDTEGRLVATTDANGNRITFAPDTSTNIEIIRDALGNPTVLEFDTMGNLVAKTNPLGGAHAIYGGLQGTHSF